MFMQSVLFLYLKKIFVCKESNCGYKLVIRPWLVSNNIFNILRFDCKTLTINKGKASFYMKIIFSFVQK